MKLRATATFVLLGSLSLSCSSKSNDVSKPAVDIAWMSKGKCNTFFDISRAAVPLAEQSINSASSRKVNVQIMDPDDCEPTDAGLSPTGDAGTYICSNQLQSLQYLQLQAAIDQKMDVIAIDVSDPACETPLVNQAVDEGIKVITFDSDAPSSQRQTYYGMDNKAAAKLALQQLATFIGDSGNIAIQTSMTKDANGVYQLSTSSTYADRMTGFNEELVNHPNIQLVATVPCTGNAVTDINCSQQIDKVLTQYPDLKGLFLARGKVLRETGLATAAPLWTAAVQAKTIHSVAFDAPQDAIASIQAGYAEFVISQKQFAWGYDVITLGFDMININRSVTPFTDSGYDVVCPNNVDAYAAMWQALDFRSPLATCQYMQ